MSFSRDLPDYPVHDQSLSEEREDMAWDAFMEQLPDAIAKELPEEFLDWLAGDPPQELLNWLHKNGAGLADRWLETKHGKAYALDAMRDQRREGA